MFIPEAFYMYRQDNPNSSISNKTKIYAMDAEYDLIKNYLDDEGFRKDFLDAFVYAKYHNFHFTMDRIGLEFKKEFLLSTSEQFNVMKNNNELDTSLLNEYDLNILNWIIEKPNEYYDYKYNIDFKHYDFLKKYLQCRIDIKNLGSKDNDIILMETTDSLQNFYAPDWFNNDIGVGHVLESNTGSLELSFKCVNDGTLNFDFRGIDYSDRKGYRIPIYIDYTEIIIDDEILVSGSKVSWHDNPFNFQKKVQDGQIIKVQVKWRPLNVHSIFKITSDYEMLLNTLSNCRIDIKNSGQFNSDIKVIDSDNPYDVSKPGWFRDNFGLGSVLTSNAGSLDISFECINDGNLNITFRSTDLRNKRGDMIPIFIEYQDIKIDGKSIIGESVILWHDTPLSYDKVVKNGQIVNVKLKWKPYNNSNFQNEELKSLKNK